MKVRSSLTGLLVGAALGLACGGAAAQGDPIPADRSELFAYLVRNPGDVQATLRYADLSKEAGDIEAAIGALERVLFYEPNEPNTRLYLGMLYAKLGSYDMARGYFESVMEHPGTPEAIKQRAAYLMNEADKRTNPHQFRGFVRTGIRYQSNANGEPDGRYFAYDPDVDDYFPQVGDPKGDWNAYVQTGIYYSYDFGTQTRDAFEASLTTYSTAHLDFDQYNYNVVEATAGVRLGFDTDHPTSHMFFKPYLIANGATLDQEPYYASGGAGAQLTIPVGEWSVMPYAQAMFRGYDGDMSFDVPPDLDDDVGLDSWIYSAGFRLSSDPRAAQRFQLHVGYERREVYDVDDITIFAVNFDPEASSTEYQNYHRATIEVRTPFDLYNDGHHILVTPSVGVRYSLHDEVDPFAPAFADLSGGSPGDIELEEREDWQYKVGLAVDYAINDMVGVGAQVSYTITDSNIPAYDTENLSVSFGPHVRF